MDELKKFDIKIAATKWEGVDPEDFMGVLQRWIQQHTVPGTLIDVADYGHIHNGHGTVLVAHEYNLSIDYNGGQPGLMYRAKRPAGNTLAARVEAALRILVAACQKLEQEPEFAGKLAFNTSAFTFTANDRLLVPDATAVAALTPSVEAAAKAVLGAKATITPLSGDPRERAALTVAG